MIGTKIDQSGAEAAGDIVGGNKITIAYPLSPAGKAQRLMQLLEEEMGNRAEIRHIIDGLQLFYIQHSKDGIVGLEAKLTHVSKDDDILIALEKKELFVKLLNKFGKYESAQRLFAYLLAKIESEFNARIHSQITTLSDADVTMMTAGIIVNPIVAECGYGPIDIDHHTVMGMLYWLAERCFVRWHQ